MASPKKSEMVLLLLIILSFIPGLLLYQQMPSQVPSHWNINGEVNGYSSRLTSVFLFPAMNLVLYFIFLFIPQIDPSRKNYAKFSTSYIVMRWAVHLFFTFVYLFILFNALRITQGQSSWNVSIIIPGGFSLLFIVIGNYLTRVRHNYFVGFRTPWTLANEQVWQKTHRLGGKLFVLSGVVGLAGIFFESTLRFALMIGPVLLTVVVTTVYSYLEFRKLQVKN